MMMEKENIEPLDLGNIVSTDGLLPTSSLFSAINITSMNYLI